MIIKRIILFTLICFAFLPLIALAEVTEQTEHKITIDLAQPRVEITTGFIGGTLEIFGVRKGDGEIAVILRGPEYDMQVRRKSSILGAWINSSGARFSGVPSYYDYALSKPLAEFLPEEELKRYEISPENLAMEKHKSPGRDEAYYKEFYESLIRNKRDKSLFAKEAQEIIFLDKDFFKVIFNFPDNVPIGDYIVHVLYFENGVLEDKIWRALNVEQVGVSGEIQGFSKKHAFIYGFLCVLLAMLAGWVSNRLRRAT